MTIRALADGPALADTGSGDYDGGVPVRMGWFDANIGWVLLGACALGVALAWFISTTRRR